MVMHMERRIIHIDMDAFFAQVEQRDHPEYRGKPVIVGGRTASRGVVATASYEARKFGVHSAMPTRIAHQLCPDGIYVRPRFDVYKSISEEIHEIFGTYTSLIEPLSLDEAYLDITQLVNRDRPARKIALEIQREIYDKVGLTSSAGVSYNKYLAKMASGMNKPSGTTVIHYGNFQEILWKLDIGGFPGVGKVTREKMIRRGIKTGRDLYDLSVDELVEIYGKRGRSFYNKARGIGTNELTVSRERKSIGKEKTFDYDINNDEEILDVLERLCGEVVRRLDLKDVAAKTVTVKMKTDQYVTHTKQMVTDNPVMTKEELFQYAYHLYHELKDADQYIRLIGVTTSSLEKRQYRNLTIFDFL